MQVVHRRHGRGRGHRPGRRRILVEPVAQGLEDHLAHGEAAVVGVLALDDQPGGVGGARLADHLLVHLLELVVGLEPFPVAVGDPPAGERVLLQALEPLLLLFFGQVQPELDDQRALVDQHGLQLLGPIQALLQVGRLGDAAHPVEDRPGVPGAEEHADLALGRQGPPEAPHHRPVEFLVRGLAHAVALDVARVHPLVEQVDGGPAAGAVQAADEDDDLAPGRLRQFELRLEQGRAQGRHLFLVHGFLDLVPQLRALEHTPASPGDGSRPVAPPMHCKIEAQPHPAGNRK